MPMTPSLQTSPLKSGVWLLGILFVLLALFPSTDAGILDSPRLTVNQVDWTERIPIERCAFVTVFNPDTTADDQTQLIQLRLMIKTLQLTKTQADILVMVSQNSKIEHRQLLTASGYRVVPVPDVTDMLHTLQHESPADLSQSDSASENLASGGSSLPVLSVPELERLRKCERSLKKLYLWSLTDYERVIFLDSSLLVLLELDELFLCGDFCMFFHSWVYYHSDLLVIKPSMAMFSKLLPQMTLVNEQRIQTLMTADSCSDAFEAMFIPVLGDMEAAPLFNPAEGQQLTQSTQRLQMNYCLNVMMFYEYFSWHLLQLAQFRHLIIPGFTIVWPSWKPTFWPLAWYFDVHWEYNNWRQLLLGHEIDTGSGVDHLSATALPRTKLPTDSYYGLVFLHVVVMTVMLWCATDGIGKLFGLLGGKKSSDPLQQSLQSRRGVSQSSTSKLLPGLRGLVFRSTQRLFRAAPFANAHMQRQLGVILLSLVLGISAMGISALLVYKWLIPPYTPPHVALPLWFSYISILCFGFFHFVCLLHFPFSDENFDVEHLIERARVSKIEVIQGNIAHVMSHTPKSMASGQAEWSLQVSPAELRRPQLIQQKQTLEIEAPARLPRLLPWRPPAAVLDFFPQRIRSRVRQLSSTRLAAAHVLPPRWMYDTASRVHFYIRNIALPFFMLSVFYFMTVVAYPIHIQFGQKIGASFALLTLCLLSFCVPYYHFFLAVSHLPSSIPDVLLQLSPSPLPPAHSSPNPSPHEQSSLDDPRTIQPPPSPPSPPQPTFGKF